MSSGTINNSTYSVRKDGGSLINGKISLTPDLKTAEFDPDQELDPGTTYIAEISERLKDLAGNAVGSISRWSFTTEERRTTIPEKPVVTEEKKPVVTEEKKPVVTEEKKPVVTEEKKPVVTEEKKPVVTEEKKPVVTEEKKPVVTEEKKPVVTDTGKIEINPENKDKISLPKEIKNAYVLLNGLTGYTIDGIDFSYNGENDMLELTNCVDCKIINCTFHDRTTKGNFIHIRGADSKHNLIENCTFKNHTGEDNNGGEAIIIGLDNWSGCLYETTVRKCEFIKCKGDPEIISIKSVDNVIENNCIRADCDGNITIRHGGRNTIQYNVFEGSAGGIRVLGCGNKIIGNYHNGNDNDKDKRRPLIIQNGDSPKDPNFNDNCEPKKKEGSGAAYAQAENNTIEDNIYDNCKGPCVVWGWRPEDKEDQTHAPKKNTFRNNTLIADKKDSEFLEIINAGDGNTFEGNKMYGSKAQPGDLPEGSAKHLGDSVNIT